MEGRKVRRSKMRKNKKEARLRKARRNRIPSEEIDNTIYTPRIHKRFSDDVRMSKLIKPLFPVRCIRCGDPTAEEQVRIRSRGLSEPTFLLFGLVKRLWIFWKYRRRYFAEVPCCRACSKEMHRQHQRRSIRYWAVLFFLPVIIFLRLTDHMTAQTWVLAAAFLYLAVVVGWELFHPQPFFITEFEDYVIYEFADRQYAKDFAKLNGASKDKNESEDD